MTTLSFVSASVCAGRPLLGRARPGRHRAEARRGVARHRRRRARPVGRADRADRQAGGARAAGLCIHAGHRARAGIRRGRCGRVDAVRPSLRSPAASCPSAGRRGCDSRGSGGAKLRSAHPHWRHLQGMRGAPHRPRAAGCCRRRAARDRGIRGGSADRARCSAGGAGVLALSLCCTDRLRGRSGLARADSRWPRSHQACRCAAESYLRAASRFRSRATDEPRAVDRAGCTMLCECRLARLCRCDGRCEAWGRMLGGSFRESTAS